MSSIATSDARIARTEGALEQITERVGNIERTLDQKAAKSEVRILFVTTGTLLVAIIGILGALIARV